MCKPIKNGVTVYPLVFSKSTYLYKWRWFLGKGANSRAAPHGQPTDTQTLDEDSEEQTGFIMDMISNDLVGKEFDNTGAVGYFDKAFSSIKLFAKLAARGVRAVGMLRAKRPKKMERGARWYWPFRSYAKEEVEDLEPGWRRAAYTQLPSGQWLAAEAWRDNRLVTMISTTFASPAAEEVKRWSRALHERVTRACSKPLKKYQEMMGGVDRFNRLNAQTGIRMGRCIRRYHRQLFLGWHLSGIGVCNVRVAFEALWPQAKDLRREWDGKAGFNWWFQDRLGRLVREHGLERAREEWGGDEEWNTPPFMPSRKKRARVSPPPKSVGQDHGDLVHCSTVVALGGWVNGHAKEYMKRDRCAHCMTLSKAAGTAGASRPKLNGKDVPKPVTVCKVCKVNLCVGCKDLWPKHRVRGDAEECEQCDE
jgi:hypothetical protein